MLLHRRRHPWKVLMRAAFAKQVLGLCHAVLVSRLAPQGRHGTGRLHRHGCIGMVASAWLHRHGCIGMVASAWLHAHLCMAYQVGRVGVAAELRSQSRRTDCFLNHSSTAHCRSPRPAAGHTCPDRPA
jgi:hypothetical protein